MASVYTFKVTMIVEVMAESLEQAEDKLDEHGGYMSARKVEYLATTSLPEVDMGENEVSVS